jgi:cytochrome c-type biogenesis protein CcsB
VTTETLAAYSLVAIYSAIAVYAIAFIAFVLDLSKRAAVSQAAVAEPAYVGASTGSTADRGTLVAEKPPVVSTGSTTGASRYQRVAFALTVLAWVIHVASIVLRGIAAGHVPWSNMFEFSSMGTALMVGVFLAVQFWRDVRFLGAFVTGLVALLLGLASVNFYVPITPLPPALQSVWLVIHVFVATLATGFFAIGGGLSIAQLLQSRREANGGTGLRFLRSFPASEALETMANRLIIVGFAFWTFTLMAGAIWAERAWGRYWGWDTKEVWTFIIWVVFAGYVHARATRGWRGNRSAWLAIIGFAAVLFNFTVVNLFFSGLHAYSGLK